ncbi:MAG: hypothetical protein IT534_01575 [Bauldia sp.]|nr:hypothetical protein [Bauldia sp.]
MVQKWTPDEFSDQRDDFPDAAAQLLGRWLEGEYNRLGRCRFAGSSKSFIRAAS